MLQDISRNGTYVNESTVSIGEHNSIELGTENVISIGEYSLRIAYKEIPNAAVSTSTDDFEDLFGKQVETPAVDEDLIDDINGDYAPPSVGSWIDDDDIGFDDSASHEFEAVQVLPDKEAKDSEDTGWIPGLDSESTTFNNDLPDQRPTSEPAIDQVDRNPFGVNSAPSPRLESATRPTSGLSAFLSGAKVDPELVAASNEAQLLEHVGEMLHVMVDGMMQLLDSRAELKNTWRSDVTRLGGTDNNPLKFSHNASEALNKLLATDTPGYQPLDRAVTEAVNDLKLHQVAMMDGMKSAVKAILLQFDPEKLSTKLKADRPITANIPLKREAELWELFCEHYEEIRAEAIDDFGELFNREFRRAYEARMARVRRQQDF